MVSPRCVSFTLFFLIAALMNFFIWKAAAESTPQGDWNSQPMSTKVDDYPAFNNSVNDQICNPDPNATAYFVYHVGPPNAKDGVDYGRTVTHMLLHLSKIHMGGVSVRFDAGDCRPRSERSEYLLLTSESL